MTDWFDKNKFKKILAIVNSNKFNHKNKIGKFKYNDIKDLIDNINKNTISEILAKKNLSTLKELKNTEIKKKRVISSQKQLLGFFDCLLDTILTKNDNNNNNNSNNNSNNNNSNNYESESENENESDNENDNNHDNDHTIRQINYCFKMIDKSESFEEQIKLLKKVEDLDYYWSLSYDDKEIKFKIFKLNLAYCLSFINEELFEKLFGYPLIKLAKKLINTTNKEENQIIIEDIKKIEIYFKKKMTIMIGWSNQAVSVLI